MSGVIVVDKFYTRIKRAIKELKDAQKYCSLKDINQFMIDRLEEQLKTRKK